MEEKASVPQPKIYQPLVSRRRQLLPWWVLTFTWFFILCLFAIPVGIVFGFHHEKLKISLFGLTTNDPFSVVGIFLITVFIFKGIVALNLWTEKKRAVSLAKLDAILSIAFSLLGFFYNIAMPNNSPGVHSFSIPIDLIVIIPYYIKINRVQYDWENFGEIIPLQNATVTDKEDI